MGDFPTIRCQIINTIKTDRYIRKANWAIIGLASLAIAVSLVSFGFFYMQPVATAHQMERLIQLQQELVKEIREDHK